VADSMEGKESRIALRDTDRVVFSFARM